MASDEELSPRGRAKRDQIREGALATFLDLGFSAASTDAIAARAGVSKQTLYAYFRSKEDLLFDVLSSFVARIERDAVSGPRSVINRTELRDALRGLAEETVHALTRADYLALVRVIIGEGQRVRQVGELWARTVPGRIRGTVTATLTTAQSHGVVRAAVPVDAATRLFVGALLTYVLPDGLFATHPESVAPTEKEVDDIVDLFLSAVAE